MKTIKVKGFEVPVGAMGAVAEIITDNELETPSPAWTKMAISCM
jgi:hypothetical protein